MSETASSSAPAVAVIGMSGRFPGAPTLDQFWQNLKDGVEAITFLSEDEAAQAGVEPDRLRDPHFVRAESRLDGVELFDAEFFDINPREAELTDPQHRLLLECAWEALENAGYVSSRFPGSIGVYAGCGINHYLLQNILSDPDLVRSVSSLQLAVAADKDYLSTRISYKLGLKGPSIGVQTACSTSLVAVHLASQALLDFQCDLALAGGASVKPPGRGGYLYEPGGILSPDGHCRAFDSRAGGTVFGSGLGLVVLKRLDEALADNDTILAVLRGSAVNNDGSLKAGYTAPGSAGQIAVLTEALDMADVDPESISYVEAHGTGTPLGDPIEVSALTQVFRASTEKRGFCALGSVKTGIGHLDAAAGIAGLIKTVLALRHGWLPPSLHFERPNPEIDFDASPFFVNAGLRPWPAGKGARRAGVSSFGIGGTNAHVVLEEAPAAAPTAPAVRPLQLLVTSGKTAGALAANSDRLAEHLRALPELALADVAWTLQVGRSAFAHRRAVVCASGAEAASALTALDPKLVIEGIGGEAGTPVVFLFPGQGAQYLEMGSGLYPGEAVFRAAFDRCAEILTPSLGLDLRRFLKPGAASDGSNAAAADAARLEETELAQPALFAVEYALAEQWIAWGVRPRAMLGHSVGEYVAACLGGTLSLEDALALVAARGRLMQRLPPGGMLSVPLPAAEVAALLGGRLSLAAENAPLLSTVSGPVDALEELAATLSGRGVQCRRLRTSHAFHSAMMEPILEPFRQELARIRLRSPQLPWVSNLTGAWIRPEEATDPAYWVSHLRHPVRFSAGLATLATLEHAALLEVGPGRTLLTLARNHPAVPTAWPVVASLPESREPGEEQRALLNALGRLWANGVEPEWRAFHGPVSRRRVPLPTYAFERRRFWVERKAAAAPASAPAPAGRKSDLADWFYVPSWKRLPWLAPATGEGGLWLLFVSGGGLGGGLAHELAKRGEAVVTVAPGAAFARRGEGAYELSPRRLEDYQSLLGELPLAGGALVRIVHLWATGAKAAGRADREAVEELETLGFYSLLHLAQALAGLSGEVRVALSVVVSGLFDVDGSELLSPAAALVLGPAKVIPQELPGLACRVIDVVSPAPGRGEETGAARLLAELAALDPGAPVALRGPHRWVQTFEPAPLPAAERPPFRQRGTYLITGGMGGLGLIFAGYLARELAARLVLIGRSAFPPRGDWPLWQDDPGPLGEQVRQLLELEAAGAEVMVASADVTDEAALGAVLTEARRRFGPLHGVLHAAGAAGGGLLLRQTAERMSPVLDPKVKGVLVLDALLAGEPLDFFALFSSTFGITGGLGRVDYVAANAFLDAFAHWRSARGGPRVLALDWYGWERTGMSLGARPERPGASSLASSPLLGEGGGMETSLRLSPARHWVLAEHRLMGRPVLPGTALLEMARAAVAAQRPGTGVELREAVFLSPLAVDEGEETEVRTALAEHAGELTFRITSRDGKGEGWRLHATGRALPFDGPAPARREPAAIRTRCAVVDLPVERRAGGKLTLWGPRWDVLREGCVGDGEGLAVLELPPAFAGDLAVFGLHPALLDVATACGLLLTGRAGYLPLSYGRLRQHAPLTRRLLAHFRVDEALSAGDTAVLEIALLTESGEVLVEVEEFTARKVDVATPPRAAAATDRPAAEGPVTGRAIRPAEGIEAFARALASGAGPQIVVSGVDLETLIREQARPPASAGEAGRRPGVAVPGTRHPRPNVGVPYRAPSSELEQMLADLWEEMLGIEQVGVHDNFFELGGHSLLAIDLASRLRETLQIEVPLSRLFVGATIAELAKLIVHLITDQVDNAELLEVLAQLEDPAYAEGNGAL